MTPLEPEQKDFVMETARKALSQCFQANCPPNGSDLTMAHIRDFQVKGALLDLLRRLELLLEGPREKKAGVL